MKPHKQLNLNVLIQPNFDKLYNTIAFDSDEYLEQLPSGTKVSAEQLGRGYDVLFLGEATHGLPRIGEEEEYPASYMLQLAKDFHGQLTHKNIDVITNYQTDLSVNNALLSINMKLYEFINPTSTLAHNIRIKPVDRDPTQATIKQIKTYFTNNIQAQKGLVVASSSEQANDIEQRIKELYAQPNTQLHVTQTQFF